jgi:hypothetical protein
MAVWTIETSILLTVLWRKKNVTESILTVIFRYFSGHCTAEAGRDTERIEAARQSWIAAYCNYVAAQEPTADWLVGN